ncbi:hypothetical protein CHU98_g9813 [Xylaria longipes]|nr:hypothetical protein CHU98_g9813 [Xylaria longipes]
MGSGWDGEDGPYLYCRPGSRGSAVACDDRLEAPEQQLRSPRPDGRYCAARHLSGSDHGATPVPNGQREAEVTAHSRLRWQLSGLPPELCRHKPPRVIACYRGCFSSGQSDGPMGCARGCLIAGLGRRGI